MNTHEPTEEELSEFRGRILQVSYDDVYFRFIGCMTASALAVIASIVIVSNYKDVAYIGGIISVVDAVAVTLYGNFLLKRHKYRTRFINRILAIPLERMFYMIEVENTAVIMDSEFYHTAARKWVARAQKGILC